ncbi:MAG: sialidase family protein [Dysgonomonas sp.]
MNLLKYFLTIAIVSFLNSNVGGQTLNISQIEALGGKVIAHSAKSTGAYIGAPSIVILPNGDYLSTHNYFGSKSNPSSYVYRSTDKGLTWNFLYELNNFTNMNLFVVSDVLYSIGFTASSGQMHIRKSTDNGASWSIPTTSQNGIILNQNLYSNAPQNVVIHNNRIWYALNDVGSAPTGWGKDKVFMMSAPADADLLDANNWTKTNYLQGIWQYGGWLEPCAVAAPNGKLYIMPRVDYRDVPEKSALIEVSDDCTSLSFDPAKDYFDFPGGCKKFTVKYDPVSKMYWTLSNYIPKQFEGGNVERSRNTLALSCSPDLKCWKIKGIVAQGSDIALDGFQYVDWLFDGNDMTAAVRTSYYDGMGGADNCHNSNLLTFHRVNDFRNFSTPTSEVIDNSPQFVEDFENRSNAGYYYIRQNSNLSSSFQIVENPNKSGINTSDSVYMIKRSKNDYWEAGIMIYLKNAVPKGKKFMHVMVNWKDKPTSFAARFYGSDKDSAYVSGVIPNDDKVDFWMNVAKDLLQNTWTDIVIPVSNYAGKDFKYLLLLPDRNKQIGTQADYYTYYLDNIIFSDEMRPRGEIWGEDCEYYGCSQPNPNEWTGIIEQNSSKSLSIVHESNGVTLRFLEKDINKLSLIDITGRIRHIKPEKNADQIFIPLSCKGVYFISYYQNKTKESLSFLF